MIIISPNKSAYPCSQCGGKLILLKKTQTKDNFSKITISSYKCSNKACQEGIDKRTKVQLALQKEQNLARERRLKLKSKSAKSKN